MTHTPRPWKVNQRYARIEDAAGLPICALLWPTEERSWHETSCNADLIAAAPDLRAALEKLCAEVQESGADIVLDEYYAAIDKAKGEKS